MSKYCFIFLTTLLWVYSGIVKAVDQTVSVSYQEISCKGNVDSNEFAQLEYMALDLLVCSIQDMTNVKLDRQNITGGAKAVYKGLVEAGVDSKDADKLVAMAIDTIFPPAIIEPAIGSYEPDIALAQIPMINESQRSVAIGSDEGRPIFMPQNDPFASPQ